VVRGSDADLAAAVARAPGALVRFEPHAASDLARAVGIASTTTGVEVPMDAIEVAGLGLAVGTLALGTSPERLTARTRSVPVTVTVDGRALPVRSVTTIVVAVAQHLHGLDVSPRGHPGDGRVEVQGYALRRRERSGMRARLARGEHLPHPRIHVASGREITVVCGRPAALEVDGVSARPVERLSVRVVPAAYRLLL
jgi:diacylglycerol kinase family enzyme